MKREPPAERKPAPKPVDPAYESMARTNAKPLDLSLLAPEDWMHKGGSAGFKLNGFSVVRRSR
jgi:hypothetical protein